jgi:hypothetical protein
MRAHDLHGRRRGSIVPFAVPRIQNFTILATDAAYAPPEIHPPTSGTLDVVREPCNGTGSGTGSSEIVCNFKVVLSR